MGSNDFGWLLTGSAAAAEFADRYVNFILDLRKYHRNPTIPIFLITPFGWYTRNTVRPIVPLATMQEIKDRAGENTYLIDTTGWLNDANAARLMLNVVHPNPDGLVYLGDKVALVARKMGLGWKF